MLADLPTALVDLQTAAARLGCSSDSLRRKIKKGVLPCYVIGPKTLRVDLSEILAATARKPTPGE